MYFLPLFYLYKKKNAPLIPENLPPPVPPGQIALEAPMACGFGGCYGCAVEIDGTWKRCCIEGPVVDGARLVA